MSFSIYILSYPYSLTLTFLRLILFEPVITLFISINESTVKHMLSSESNKLFHYAHQCIFLFFQN